MTVHDDARFDSIAVLALGSLPADEARELLAHIAECELCRREYDEMRGAVDALALSAEVTPSEFGGVQGERLRSRVMDAVRATLPASAPPAASKVVDLATRRRVPAWFPGTLVAALILFALVSSWNVIDLRSQNNANRSQIALLTAQVDGQQRDANQARAQLALTESRLADMISPGAVRFPVKNGQVVRSAGRLLIALHLPALPKGKTYQAWTLRRGAKTVTPSITFAPDAGGLALVELPEPAGNVAAVAVSVEPEGGSKQPTSKPTFVRSLG
jgi:type II secretory pathway pseudopilin PulG